jgi:hypothetical protein
MLGVHAVGFPGGEPEKSGIKLIVILDETAPAGRRLARDRPLGVVKSLVAPAIWGRFNDTRSFVQQ